MRGPLGDVGVAGRGESLYGSSVLSTMFFVTLKLF